jgi:glycerophosphoryl diester phosphodiesterase
VLHDDTLDRTTNGQGPVAAMSFAAVRKTATRRPRSLRRRTSQTPDGSSRSRRQASPASAAADA